MKLILLANLGATLIMVGAIWIIQIVHYPLFARVGVENFAVYEAEHSTRIMLVVMPLMLLELGTALLLALSPPEGIRVWEAWLGVGLVIVVWLVTFLFSVPQHSILSSGYDAAAQQRLVATNWLRTLAWSGRGLLALLWAGRLMGVGG